MLEFKRKSRNYLVYQISYMLFIIFNITYAYVSITGENDLMGVLTGLGISYITLCNIDIFIDSIFNYWNIHTILGISKLFFYSKRTIEHKDLGFFKVYLKKRNDNYILEVHKQNSLYTKLVGRTKIENNLSTEEVKVIVYSILDGTLEVPVIPKDIETKDSFNNLS